MQGARAWGLILANPMDAIPAPKGERTPTIVLDDDQLARATDAIEGHPLRAPFTLLVYAGVRMGEMLGLRWSDIDWGNGTVRLVQNWNPVTKKFGRTKSH